MHITTRRWPLAIAIVSVCCIARMAPVHAQTSSSKPATPSAKSAGAVDLPLIDVAGYNRVLAKYKGKPLLVTFWATWCEPCRDEYPMLVQLAKQYSPHGLSVFGVSLDDDADMNLVRHFLAQNQPAFPNFRQKPGIDVDEFYHGVNPNWMGGMPDTILYGRDGSIAANFVGEQTRETFEKAVQAILAAPNVGSHAASPSPSRASN
jgi:thiol-disulfide isomerase/thioredoxin